MKDLYPDFNARKITFGDIYQLDDMPEILYQAEDVPMERQEKIINSATSILTSSYMSYMITIPVTDSYFTENNKDMAYDSNLKDKKDFIVRNIYKTMDRLEKLGLIWKIDSPRYSMSCHVLLQPDDDEKHIHVVLFRVDKLTGIGIISMYLLTRNKIGDNKYFNDIANLAAGNSIYISSNNNEWDFIKTRQDLITNILYEAVRSFIGICKDKDSLRSKSDLPEYSQTELELYKFMFKNTREDSNNITKFIYSRMNYYNIRVHEGINTSKFVNKNELNPIETELINRYNALGFDVAPLIDLSEKELNFISTYVKKKITKSDKINLVPALVNCRYGNQFNIPITKINNRIKSLYVNFEVYPDDDMVKFYLFYYGQKGMVLMYIILLDHISSFKPNDPDNVLLIISRVGIKNYDSLVKDDSELSKYFDKSLLYYNDIMMFLEDIIGIILVMHDRPERTKMIKCTERKSSKSKKNIKNKSNKDFIVTRILKSTKEAKEYIQKMGSRAEAEYVLESWERKGHWRSIHNSNKKIWIEPTTCKRHKELSKKEIHIKL